MEETSGPGRLDGENISPFQNSHSGFNPSVSFRDVSFKYPGSLKPTLESISFEGTPGQVIAIVGPSGAGKTTLIDLLLGLLTPASGEVLISDRNPVDAISSWPGAVSYVPQDILISSGSVLDNVILGFNNSDVPMSQVERALEIAQLSEVVAALPKKIDTNVGDRGTLLSGGQRQRLGIARALLTSPKLIVLDEATSALDGQTEADLSEAINKLKQQATVILVAHRLSTIKHADQVIYIAGGAIQARGTFDQIRLTVPDFEKQVQLMGL
jgi:ABC-type multidrug transport system fused ATPase/permease subunit